MPDILKLKTEHYNFEIEVTNNILHNWICYQLKNFNKYNIISKLWNDFIDNEKYKQYFISNEEQWKQKLEELKIFISRCL